MLALVEKFSNKPRNQLVFGHFSIPLQPERIDVIEGIGDDLILNTLFVD